MSADNYILIRKEAGEWVGYMESASLNEPRYEVTAFKVGRIEDTILHAQETETEYGYRFEGLGEDAS